MTDQANETISFDSESEYLTFITETTKSMLGILHLEMKQARTSGAMTPMDLAHFTITMDIITQLQAAAMMMEEREPGHSHSPPVLQLVKTNGTPLS
jgi:hypothetical protein